MSLALPSLGHAHPRLQAWKLAGAVASQGSIGLYQRLALGALQLWVALLAIQLLRPSARAGALPLTARW